MKNNGNLLIGEVALASVIPKKYAHYRRLVQGALGQFIALLNPDQ